MRQKTKIERAGSAFFGRLLTPFSDCRNLAQNGETSGQKAEGGLPSVMLPTHKALAIGLWIAAFGIFLQAATGEGSPKVPPGIPILAALGLIVYFTSRWTWTAWLGLFLAGLITIGVFTTPGTAWRLRHPQEVGPLIGTLVQLAGLALALIAGIATTARSRKRSAPQG
jgi:hypothetical protein